MEYPGSCGSMVGQEDWSSHRWIQFLLLMVNPMIFSWYTAANRDAPSSTSSSVGVENITKRTYPYKEVF
ncbi:hypothetical protein LDENG_00202480 [Lucifuga dentata]|nr:hypothetical protein LDENG_00202480 [Lucifuga dentata]